MSAHARSLALSLLAVAAVSCSKNTDVPPSTCGGAAPRIVTVAVTQGGAPVSRADVGAPVEVTVTALDPEACDTVASFVWSLVSAPAGSTFAVPSDAHGATLTVTPDLAGTFQLRVVALDRGGNASEPAVATVATGPCGPAIASPGFTFTPAMPGAGEPVTLTAAQVTDACVRGGSFTYGWTLSSRPPTSAAVLGGTAGAATAFVPDVPGPYELQLAVGDAGGFSTVVTRTVAVGSACALAPTLTGAASTSPAAPNVGDLVTLSPPTASTACADPRAATFSYEWTLLAAPAGSSAVLAPSGNGALLVADVANATWTAMVVAVDGLGNRSAPALVTFTTTRCGANPPVVAVSPVSVTANARTPVAFTALATDADATCPAAFASPVAAWAWRVASAPAGASPVLSAAGATATLVGDAPGTYVVQAVATDVTGLESLPATATILVSGCGSHAPSIASVSTTVGGVPTSRPAVGSAVVVAPIVADADQVVGGACGDAPMGPPLLTWTLVSVPAGSAVTAPAGPTAGPLTFTADVAGTYTFRVVATDPLGLSSEPVEVTIPTGTCGPNLAGISASAPAPTIGTTVSLAPQSTTGGAVTSACVAAGGVAWSWSLLSRPPGSAAALAGPATAGSDTLVPDVAGSYVVQLVATDSGGFSTVAQRTLVAGGCTSAPVVSRIDATASDPDGAVPPAGSAYRGDRVTLAPSVLPGSCGAVSSTAFTYEWSVLSRPAGSVATLGGADASAPSLVADVSSGTWQLMLVVRDALGNASPAAYATIQTTDCGARRPPSTVVAVPAAPHAHQPVQLVASVTDPEASAPACPVRFQNPGGSWPITWSVVSGPSGAHPQLAASGAQAATFSADAAGLYQVQAAATGLSGAPGSPTPLLLTVDACGTYPPVVSSFALNQSVPGGPVIADAVAAAGGAASSARAWDAGFPVTLQAAVTDADLSCGFPGQTFQRRWSLAGVPVGSAAVLSSPDPAWAALTPDLPGTYAVTLEATDDLGNASTTRLTFTVGTCGAQAPTVAAPTAVQAIPGGPTFTTPGSLAVGYPAALAATAQDPDDACLGAPQALTWAWRIVSAAPGSTAALVGASTATPSFTPDVSGSWVVEVTVTDPQGHSARAQQTLDATCGGTPPTVANVGGAPSLTATQVVPSVTAAAGAVPAPLVIQRSAAPSPQPFYVGFPVGLRTTVVDAGALCGLPPATVGYAWSFTAVPPGSTARLNDASLATPSFTPDLPGEYDLRLVLTDGAGRSSTTSFAVVPGLGAPYVLAGSCNAQAPSARITVTAPIASSPGAAEAAEPSGTRAFLDGSGSFSLDAMPVANGGCGLPRTLAYAWSFDAVPPAYVSTIATNGPAASFPLDVPGRYVARLTVSDGARSDAATVAVSPDLVALPQQAASAATFTAAALDPTTGTEVLAWSDLGSGGAGSPVYVARCTAGCATLSPTWSVTPIDDLGDTPFAWSAGAEPRPLDLKVASDGAVVVAYGTGPTTTAAGGPPCAAMVATLPPGQPPVYGRIYGGTGCDAAGLSGSQAGRWLSLALLPGDLPALAFTYTDRTGGYALPGYASCADRACGAVGGPFAVSSGVLDVDGARWPSLAITAYTAPALVQVAYTENVGGLSQLDFAECAAGCATPSAWTVRALGSGPGGYGRHVLLRPTGWGGARAAFADASEVYTASCDSGCAAAGAWSIAPAWAIGTSGLGLATDDATGAGFPWLAARDAASGAVSLARAPAYAQPVSSAYPLAKVTGPSPSVVLPKAGAVRLSIGDGGALRTIRFGVQ